MKIKERAKAFWDEHKIEIEAGAVVVGVAVTYALVGAYIGRRIGRNDVIKSKWYVGNERVANFLQSAMDTHPKTFAMGDYVNPKGIELNQLGDIGKKFIDMSAPGDSVTFTHILMIGPDNK